MNKRIAKQIYDKLGYIPMNVPELVVTNNTVLQYAPLQDTKKYGIASSAYEGQIYLIKSYDKRRYYPGTIIYVSKNTMIDYLNKVRGKYYVIIEYFYNDKPMERKCFYDSHAEIFNDDDPYLIYISRVFSTQR